VPCPVCSLAAGGGAFEESHFASAVGSADSLGISTTLASVRQSHLLSEETSKNRRSDDQLHPDRPTFTRAPIHLLRASCSHASQSWPSNSFSAAPSRATPAGSPRWPRRLRSACLHRQHYSTTRSPCGDDLQRRLTDFLAAPTCFSLARATRPSSSGT